MPDDEKKIELACTVSGQELAQYVNDPSARVIRAVLKNANLLEEDVLIIAQRKNLPADILEYIAKDKRWSESYPVRLALARNPRSPLSVSLTQARYLRLFDLEEITHSHHVPLVFRNKVEAIICERIPSMPLGNKKTLAKKAVGTVLLRLLYDPDADVVKLCLNNPHLTEAHLYKIISRSDTVERTIRMIAEHPNWSSRSLIRLSLARNTFTPLSLSLNFLQGMKIMDLKELYHDPAVPITIKPFIHRELWERGQDAKKAVEDQIFEIDEEEVAEIEREENIPSMPEEDSE